MANHRETAKHRKAFEDWYAANREFGKIWQNLATPERTLRNWAEWFEWHKRADARDLEAQRIADTEAAKERADRQKRRRRAAELMTARGMEFFQTNKIDTPQAAIQAIKAGLENERKEDGVPDWVIMILNADANDLEKMGKLLGGPLSSGASESEDFDSLPPESDAEEED